jgi:thiamine biosynthesis lipoprotein
MGPETLMCDALSTALFVSPRPEKILQKFPEYGAVVIDSGGNIVRMGKAYPARRED